MLFNNVANEGLHSNPQGPESFHSVVNFPISFYFASSPILIFPPLFHVFLHSALLTVYGYKIPGDSDERDRGGRGDNERICYFL